MAECTHIDQKVGTASCLAVSLSEATFRRSSAARDTCGLTTAPYNSTTLSRGPTRTKRRASLCSSHSSPSASTICGTGHRGTMASIRAWRRLAPLCSSDSVREFQAVPPLLSSIRGFQEWASFLDGGHGGFKLRVRPSLERISMLVNLGVIPWHINLDN